MVKPGSIVWGFTNSNPSLSLGEIIHMKGQRPALPAFCWFAFRNCLLWLPDLILL